MQNTSVFQTELPVIDRSLADLLNTSEKLDALALELEQNPPATINEAIARINALLGSAAFAFSNGVLELNLGYGFAVSHQLNLGFDLDDSLSGVLEQFVDLSANAPISMTAFGNATLGLGIDINGGSPEFFLTNTSGITLGAMVELDRHQPRCGDWPLGRLHSQRRRAAGQRHAGTGRHVDHVAGRRPQPHWSGRAARFRVARCPCRRPAASMPSLPVSFPRPDVPQGAITLQVPNLNNLGGTMTLIMPDFAAAIASLDLSDLLGTTIDGWDGVIRLLAGCAGWRSAGREGAAGGRQAGRDRRLPRRLAGRRDRTARSRPSSSARRRCSKRCSTCLAPAGLNWLVDRPTDSDTLVTVDDVVIITVLDAMGMPEEFDFQFALAGTYDVGTSIDFDLGLDGLGLDIDGAVDLAIAFQMDVGFGLSRDEGFYFHSDAAPELSVSLVATLPGASATASLAFLQLSATDSATDPTHFTATLTVDLLDPNGDGRLTLAEMTGASSISEVVTARLSGEAEVNLHLAAGTTHPSLPSIEADFHLLWQFDTNDPSLAGEIQSLEFSDVKINLGQFVNNLVEPVLSKVQMALGPVMPVIDALTSPVPVISDLAGREITLLDLATQFGSVSPTTAAFIEAVASFTTDLPNYTGFIHLGDLVLDGDAARDATNLGKLQSTVPAAGPSAERAGQGPGDRGSLRLLDPDSPRSGQGLRPAPGARHHAHDLRDAAAGVRVRLSQVLPRHRPAGRDAGGRDRRQGRLRLRLRYPRSATVRQGGFDDPAVIANGFFVSDRVNVDGTGDDVREVEFYGGLAAYAAVSVAVAEMGVGGGLKATIGLDLNDPDSDGKVYWQEIVGQLEQGSLVNVSGELTAFLRAYLTIDLGLFSKTWEKNFAETELASFSYNPAPGATPVLGEVDAMASCG